MKKRTIQERRWTLSEVAEATGELYSNVSSHVSNNGKKPSSGMTFDEVKTFVTRSRRPDKLKPKCDPNNVRDLKKLLELLGYLPKTSEEE